MSWYIVMSVGMELSYLSIFKVPYVRSISESHGKIISERPVNSIQVIVILKIRRIQNFEGSFGDYSAAIRKGFFSFKTDCCLVVNVFIVFYKWKTVGTKK